MNRIVRVVAKRIICEARLQATPHESLKSDAGFACWLQVVMTVFPPVDDDPG